MKQSSVLLGLLVALAFPLDLDAADIPFDKATWQHQDGHTSLSNGKFFIKGPHQSHLLTPSLPDGRIGVKITLIEHSHAEALGFGLIFRLQPTHRDGYHLQISRNGYYRLLKTSNNGAKREDLLPWQPSPHIITGINAHNTLEVVIHGNRFLVYINGKPHKQVTDTAYKAGTLGLSANTGQVVAFASFSQSPPGEEPPPETQPVEARCTGKQNKAYGLVAHYDKGALVLMHGDTDITYIVDPTTRSTGTLRGDGTATRIVYCKQGKKRFALEIQFE